MKSRIKQPVVTRQALLDAAGGLFAQHGYAGTGIGAVVKTAKVTKGALFHHFPDKRQLALCWIEQSLKPGIVTAWVEPLQAVQSLSDLISFWRSACLSLSADDACSALVAVTAEVADQDDAMSQALDEVFSLWRASIEAVLERGQQDGWIHTSIQPATEAGILVSMVSGFSVLLKCDQAGGSRAILAGALEAYLETLRPV